MNTKDTPSHLNCPYCPAQAFPVKAVIPGSTSTTGYLLEYLCPARHRFYIGEDTSFNHKEDEWGPASMIPASIKS